ncbi:hypothetical protein C5C07_15475 [Haloferax sp. Atlit-4N]|uniref:hypothetical protein n=1 Tax=Haloferax sp. Atlit-4N TaxID=2077206 RepID=UPI000E2318D4|nr:hypothetical protein [Haloferax sp. Atlit-4N]RDZ53134.1 hypothetical protein C5C07_15475 [Haloferax sp. Atlit-4N]
MVQRAAAIADRLEEDGIRVSRKAMRRTIWSLKSDERIQGKDREIFERAVKLAVKHAGRH